MKGWHESCYVTSLLFMQFTQILLFYAKEAGLRFSFLGCEVAATRSVGWGSCNLCYCSLSEVCGQHLLNDLCISGSHAHRENERSQCKSCGTYLGTNVRVTKSSFSFLLAANCQYNSGSLQSCIGRIQFMILNQFKHFHTSPFVSFSFA